MPITHLLPAASLFLLTALNLSSSVMSSASELAEAWELFSISRASRSAFSFLS